ncbi:MAG: glycosyltransferase family 4 protein [Chitinophagaceae bacterium]|nr:glycosyltransferase family 4 protein [Chitinophagaceae bacterium]
MSANKKLIRITTVPMALRYLLPGQMRYMSAHGFEVLMISANGRELESVIRNEQCRHLIVPMTRKITPWQDLRCLIRLIRIFRKERPDIVHTHTPKAGLLGMLAARFCGVRIRIHTVAGLPLMVEKGFRYRLLRLTEKLTYSSATQVWPNSHSLCDFIRSERLAPAAKLQVIGKGSTNGIDLDRFSVNALQEEKIQQARSAIGYSASNKYLLCIGRLVADKGIVELIRVFDRLQEKHPYLRLILVGDYEKNLDPLPADIESEIEKNPSIIHISWTDEVEYFLHVADHFIFPSHREGFPNVLLQAGAMGLPVICSRIAGNVDIVTHLKTGLIFDDRDEADMFNQVEFSLSNPQKVSEMAAALEQEIRENYRRENIWQNLLEAYKSLVN